MSDTDDSKRRGLSEAELRAFTDSHQTVTNDAVAGETIEPGPGDGNDGPTGGAEREAEPIEYEHRRDDDDPNDAPEDLDPDDGEAGAP